MPKQHSQDNEFRKHGKYFPLSWWHDWSQKQCQISK